MRLLAVALLAAALLAGCGESKGPAFQATDITGADFGKDFRLRDAGGTPRSLADFRGKVVVLFFGYTHCPDICPTTLAELAAAMKKLGSDADKVQVLFVTVDPQRDTPELLARYVPSFDARFLGLYGTLDETAKAARDFKVIFQKQGGGADYTVDHSAGSYIFDPQGRLRLYVAYGQGADAFVHDIRQLLAAAT